MEVFFTGKSFLIKGTPVELKAYLNEAAAKHITVEELIKANLN